MLDRHAIQELGRARVTARAIAKQFGVSVRTVRRILREDRVTTGDEGAARRAREIGRPSVARATRERVAALVGGVPLRVVFDNPKTVILRHDEGRPVWNPVLAPVAIDYGFTVELCTPRQPQQKGAVENLVGYVKRAFPCPPLHGSRDRSAAAARRVARRSQHDAAESRDEGGSCGAPGRGAAADEAARDRPS